MPVINVSAINPSGDGTFCQQQVRLSKPLRGKSLATFLCNCKVCLHTLLLPEMDELNAEKKQNKKKLFMSF